MSCWFNNFRAGLLSQAGERFARGPKFTFPAGMRLAMCCSRKRLSYQEFLHLVQYLKAALRNLFCSGRQWSFSADTALAGQLCHLPQI